MKGAGTYQITVSWAFEAARIFFDELSHELHASDLFTLSFEMERTKDTGQTNDPALDEEWAMEWGNDAFKDRVGAFQVATRFLDRERGWSEESDLQLLLTRCKKMAYEGFGTDFELTGKWNRAIAATSGVNAEVT